VDPDTALPDLLRQRRHQRLRVHDTLTRDEVRGADAIGQGGVQCSGGVPFDDGAPHVEAALGHLQLRASRTTRLFDGPERVDHPDPPQRGFDPSGLEVVEQRERVPVQLRDRAVSRSEPLRGGAAPEPPQPGRERGVGERSQVQR
jgi:hypothetical protein